LKQFIKVMKAMSEPNRVKMLKLLQQKELCVCELQALLELAQPTISKHLKLLEDAGLVDSYKDKLWVNYRLAKGEESIYARNLLKNLSGWLKDDPEIANLMLKSLNVNRETLCKT
jgi:ArsR family transcriptional regulator